MLELGCEGEREISLNFSQKSTYQGEDEHESMHTKAEASEKMRDYF